MTETLSNGYSFESTQSEVSNEYQFMVFNDLCILSALDESSLSIGRVIVPLARRESQMQSEVIAQIMVKICLPGPGRLNGNELKLFIIAIIIINSYQALFPRCFLAGKYITYA